MSTTVRVHKRQGAPTVRAVVDDGVLRLLDSLDIPNGQTVEISVTVVPGEAERMRAERVEKLGKALDALQAGASEYPEAWWDEFEKELAENRLRFEERF